MMMKFIGAGITVLGLASAAGWKVGTNYQDADFGKIVVGKTRFDIWGGFQQYVRLILRMKDFVQKTSVEGDQPRYGESDVIDLLGDFIEYKAAPGLPSVATRIARGKAFGGGPLNIPKEALISVVPLILEDMHELIKLEGPDSIWKLGPAVYGVGVQTYEPKSGRPRRPIRRSRPRRP